LAASTSTVYTGPSPTGSGTYGIFAAQANQAYQDALNQIQQQRSSLLNQSGWQATFDPTGNVTGYSVANNPTGGYQQLLGSLAGQGQQQQALQASGLGFQGGLANHSATAEHYADSLATTGFANNLLSQLSDLSNQQVQAGDTYNNALANEQLNLTNQQVSKGLFNPANPPPLKTVTVGGKTRQIFGYGLKGNPFYTAAGAKAHGRLGKGRAR
jgi:hypothetical protein